MINPWIGVEKNCLKRVKIDLDVFLAKDSDNRNMFIINLLTSQALDISKIKLNGLSLDLQTNDMGYRLILSQHNNDDWEIFYKLCIDIISVIRKCEDNISTTAIINRLKRWQEFLQPEIGKKYPIEKQIGLFTEITFLKTIAEHLGYETSVNSWVGPDKDKQDFRLKGINIEIKSYLDQKRNHIAISSLEQLNPLNGDLYLKTYGLVIDENGKNIKQLIQETKQQIIDINPSLVDAFDTLILSYEFIDFIDYTNLLSFSVFEEDLYLVTNNFPKINLSAKNEALSCIKYQIDLSFCNDFKYPENNLINLLSS